MQPLNLILKSYLFTTHLAPIVSPPPAPNGANDPPTQLTEVSSRIDESYRIEDDCKRCYSKGYQSFTYDKDVPMDTYSVSVICSAPFIWCLIEYLLLTLS